MNKEKQFELIKQLLAEGYTGSISDIINQQEQQEAEAMQAQAQAEQQGQSPMPTPALAGNMPSPPQQSSTERNIIQPGQYKKGGIKLNFGLERQSYEDGGVKEEEEEKKAPERKGVYKLEDGDVATHLMRTEQLEDGSWVSFPTLFQNSDSSWVNMSEQAETDWVPVYEEAKKRGEIIDFGDDKDAAIDFGEGSWTPPAMEKTLPEVEVVGYKSAKSKKIGTLSYITNDLLNTTVGKKLQNLKFKDKEKLYSEYKSALDEGLSLDMLNDDRLKTIKHLRKSAGITKDELKDLVWDQTSHLGRLKRFAARKIYKHVQKKLKYGGTYEDGGVQDTVQEYTHIPMDSVINRQQYMESKFDSDAVSSAGARGISQITKQTYEEGKKKGWVDKNVTYKQLIASDKLSTEFQKNYMNDLLNRSWNKGNKEVKRAKALAAYNMGPTRLVNILNTMKKEGYDIYDDTLWIDDLPKYHKYLKGSKKGESITETRDYVKTIMYGGDDIKYIETSPDKSRTDTVTWEDRYNREYKKKFNKKNLGGYRSQYEEGGEKEEENFEFDTESLLQFQPPPAVASTTSVYTPPIIDIEPEEEEENIIETKKENKTSTETAEEPIVDNVDINMLPFMENQPPAAVASSTYVHIEPFGPELEIDPKATQILNEQSDIDVKSVLEIQGDNKDITKRRNKNKEKKVVAQIKEEADKTLKAFHNQYKNIDYDEASANQVMAIQQTLVDNGYNLGKYGPNRDGVDGKFGPKTKLAYEDYMYSKLKTNNPITFSPESRETRCEEDGCAEYVTNEFINEGYDVDKMDIGGDAWTMYDQIITRGKGTSKYNIYENISGINSSQSARRKSYEFVKNNPIDRNLLSEGDVVGLVYDPSSNWGTAFDAVENDGTHFYGDKIKHKTYNSHVGFVSGFNEDGDPIISHNIGGTVYNDVYNKINKGGIAWIATPNAPRNYKYDYTENETEHDNSEILNFFDEKNFEGQTNEDGSQKTYSPEVKEIQNNSINFIKNNVPIILDELEIDIEGDDGEGWLMEAVIGVSMTETGMGANLPDGMNITRDRILHNQIPFKNDVSLDPNTFSLGITKTKLSGVGKGTKNYYGINEHNIDTDHNRLLAVTIDNLSRNYAHIKGYAKDNPQLGLEEEDIRNMTILSHNRGLLSRNSAGGGTGTYFGQRNDMTIDEQIESLRSMYEGSMRDVSSTKYRYLPDAIADPLYTVEFGEEGAETYISKVNRYINRQIQTHEALAKKEEEERKNIGMLQTDVIRDKAEFGGYRSKYGW